MSAGALVSVYVSYPEAYGPINSMFQIPLDSNGHLTTAELLNAIYNAESPGAQSPAPWVPAANRVGLTNPSNSGALIDVASTTDLYSTYIAGGTAGIQATPFLIKNVNEYTATWDSTNNRNTGQTDTRVLQFLLASTPSYTEAQWVQQFYNWFIMGGSPVTVATLNASLNPGVSTTSLSVTAGAGVTLASGQAIYLTSGTYKQVAFASAGQTINGAGTLNIQTFFPSALISSGATITTFPAAQQGTEYSSATAQAHSAFDYLPVSGTAYPTVDATSMFYGLRAPGTSTILAANAAVSPGVNYLFTMIQRYPIATDSNATLINYDFPWTPSTFGQQNVKTLISSTGTSVSNGFTVPMLFNSTTTLTDANIPTNILSGLQPGATADSFAPNTYIVKSVVEWTARVPGVSAGNSQPNGYGYAFPNDQSTTLMRFATSTVTQTPAMIVDALDWITVPSTVDFPVQILGPTTTPQIAITNPATALTISALPSNVPANSWVTVYTSTQIYYFLTSAAAVAGATTINVWNPLVSTVQPSASVTIGSLLSVGALYLGQTGLVTSGTYTPQAATTTTISLPSNMPTQGPLLSGQVLMLVSETGGYFMVTLGSTATPGATSLSIASPAYNVEFNSAGVSMPSGSRIYTVGYLQDPAVLTGVKSAAMHFTLQLDNNPTAAPLDPGSAAAVAPGAYVLVPIIPVNLIYETVAGQLAAEGTAPTSISHASILTVGLPATATVGQLLSLPSVVSKIVPLSGTGATLQLNITDPSSNATGGMVNSPQMLFSRALTLTQLNNILSANKNGSTTWGAIGVFCYFVNVVNFNITAQPSGTAYAVPAVYSQIIGTGTAGNGSGPLGDNYQNLLLLGMQAAGVSNTSSQHYALLANDSVGHPNQMFGELDLVAPPQVIQSTDITILALQPTQQVAVSVDGSPIGAINVWAPYLMQVQDVIVWIFNNASNLGVNYYAPNAAPFLNTNLGVNWDYFLTVVGEGLTGKPHKPYLTLQAALAASVSPNLVVFAPQSGLQVTLTCNSTDSALLTMNNPYYAGSGNGIARKVYSNYYTGNDWVLIAGNRYADIGALEAKGIAFTTLLSVNVNAPQVPAYVILEANASLVVNDISASAWKLANDTGNVVQIWVKQADPIDVLPPPGVALDDMTENFSQDIRVYDVINWAMGKFNLASTTSTAANYQLILTSDPTKTTLSPLQTLGYIQDGNPSATPLQFQLLPSVPKTVDITYLGALTQLMPLPSTLPIAGVMQVASETIQTSALSDSLLEVTYPQGVQNTDLLSAWVGAKSGSSNTNTAAFTVSVAQAVQVVVLDSNGAIYFQQKMSTNVTFAQLAAIITNDRHLGNGIQLQFMVLQSGVPPSQAASTATVGSFQQPLQANGPGMNTQYLISSSVDPTIVNGVTLLRLVQTPVSGAVTVQNLYNTGLPQSISVAPNATVADLAAAAATAYGLSVGLPGGPTWSVGIAPASPTIQPTALALTTPVDFTQTYILIETDSPLQYVAVKCIFVGQTPSEQEVDAIYGSNVPLSQLVGFDPSTQSLSLLPNNASPLTNLTATVGSQAIAGVATFYIIQNPGTTYTIPVTYQRANAIHATVSSGIMAQDFLNAVRSAFGLSATGAYTVYLNGSAIAPTGVMNFNGSSTVDIEPGSASSGSTGAVVLAVGAAAALFLLL